MLITQLHRASTFNIIINNNTIAVTECHIVKEPFKGRRPIRLPYKNRKDILIYIPTNQPLQEIRVIIDAIMIGFGVNPILGGIVVKPLDSNDQLVLTDTTPVPKTKDFVIDSELVEKKSPILLQTTSNRTTNIVFRGR